MTTQEAVELKLRTLTHAVSTTKSLIADLELELGVTPALPVTLCLLSGIDPLERMRKEASEAAVKSMAQGSVAD